MADNKVAGETSGTRLEISRQILVLQRSPPQLREQRYLLAALAPPEIKRNAAVDFIDGCPSTVVRGMGFANSPEFAALNCGVAMRNTATVGRRFAEDADSVALVSNCVRWLT